LILFVIAPLPAFWWGADFVRSIDFHFPEIKATGEESNTDDMAKGEPTEDEGILYDFRTATQVGKFLSYTGAEYCVRLAGIARGQRVALAEGKGNPSGYDMHVVIQRRYGRSPCGESFLKDDFAEIIDIKTGIATNCSAEMYASKDRRCTERSEN
jgi:hypothetical protein